VDLNQLRGAVDMIAGAVKRTPTQAQPWSEWATVASAGAVPTVTLDSDWEQTPRPVSANAAGPLTVGWRVLVLHEGSRITIVSAGSAWQAMRGETLAYTFPGRTWSANDFQQVSLSFARTYPAAPLVVAYPSNAPGGSSTLRAEVVATSTTGCTVRVWNSSSSSVTTGGDLDIRVDVVPILT